VSDAPKFLFVPVSGPAGAGEYFRSLAVARAVERRWPGCSIKFIVSRDATYARNAPYAVLPVERSPTFETREVNAILERERPDIVVFDSAGRAAQYRHARELGARVVFVSSRPSTRSKGFRRRRMRWLDQHWIAQPRFLGGELGMLERLRLRLTPTCRVDLLEVLHEPVDEPGTRRLQLELGVAPDNYVLACPGGGGVFSEQPDAARVYFDAACTLNRETGIPVVAVLGSRFVPPADVPSGVRVIEGLPNSVLMGLLRDARAGMINGGSLLLQALAMRTPCVAAPIARDQPARIASCASRGYARPAKLQAASLAGEAAHLLSDPAGRAELRDRLVALDLRNGLDVALAALARLAPAVARDHSDASIAHAGRLRIMHVILSRGFAGSERAAAEACNELCDGHDVALVVRRGHRSPEGASIRDHLDPRVRVFEVPGLFGSRRRIGESIRAWRPDVVHTHLRRGTRFVAQLGPDAAHVCTLHISLNGPHYLRTDGLFCISEWQVETVPADYRGQVYLMPNTLVPQPRLGPAEVRRLRAGFGACDRDFVVGGVGRLAWSKGFDVLVRAFEAAALPNSRLVIVGEGRQRRRLERLAGPGVTITGFRADAKALYQAFDLFVSPSRSEPFGRVIVEALDAGTPVIASDTLGPRDISRRYPIEIVPRDDVAALAAALRRAAARTRSRTDLDLSEFHSDRIVVRMLDAYHEVLALRERRLRASRTPAPPPRS
jgi:glycosyltransferase involved in cell wall biosynthesis